MIERLTLVTGNESKARIYEEILGFPMKTASLELVEIQEVDVARIAEHKAKEAYSKVEVPVIVDDVGLYINSLGGLPGGLIKWFLKAGGGNASLVLEMLENKNDRSAYAELAIGYCSDKGAKVFSGRTDGSIAHKMSEKSDFTMGFDTVFVPNGFDIPFSELLPEDKKRVSHRAKALNELRQYLESQGK